MALHRFSGVVSRHDSYPDSNLFLTLLLTIQSSIKSAGNRPFCSGLSHSSYQISP